MPDKINLRKLERNAEKATSRTTQQGKPTHWFREESDPDGQVRVYSGYGMNRTMVADGARLRDAKHIANCDPDTVRKLVAAVRTSIAMLSGGNAVKQGRVATITVDAEGWQSFLSSLAHFTDEEPGDG